MDWSEGRCEKVAAELMPATEAVIEHAARRPGERVLDVVAGRATRRRSPLGTRHRR